MGSFFVEGTLPLYPAAAQSMGALRALPPPWGIALLFKQG